MTGELNIELEYARCLAAAPVGERLGLLASAFSNSAYTHPERGVLPIKPKKLANRACRGKFPPVEIRTAAEVARFLRILLMEKGVDMLTPKMGADMLKAAKAMSTHATKMIDPNTKTSLYVNNPVAGELPYYGSCTQGLGAYTGNAAGAFAGKLLGAKLIIDGRETTIFEALAGNVGIVVEGLRRLGASKILPELQQLAADRLAAENPPVEGDTPCVLFPTRERGSYVAVSPTPNYRETINLAEIPHSAPKGRVVRRRRYKVGGTNPINAGVLVGDAAGWVTSLFGSLPEKRAHEANGLPGGAEANAADELITSLRLFQAAKRAQDIFEVLHPKTPDHTREVATTNCAAPRMPLQEAAELGGVEQLLAASLNVVEPLSRMPLDQAREVFAHARRLLAGEPLPASETLPDELANAAEEVASLIQEWLSSNEDAA